MSVYPRGTVVAFSEGEYSDFGYAGHVVTVVDCDFPALAKEFSKNYKPKDEWDRPDPHSFIAWLVVNEKCFPATVSEVHLGEYGRLSVAQ